MCPLLRSIGLAIALSIGSLTFPIENLNPNAVAGPVIRVNPNPIKSQLETESELKAQLATLQQTLDIFRKSRNSQGIAKTLNEIGDVYKKLKQYDQAIKIYQEALAIYIQLKEAKGETNILGSIVDVYFKSSDYQKAEQIISQNIDSFRKSRNENEEKLLKEVLRYRLAESWKFSAGFGMVSDRSIEKEYKEGKISWQGVLELSRFNLFVSRLVQDHQQEIESLHGIGWAYRNLGEFPNALDYYNQAITVAKLKSERFHIIFLLVEVGIVYLDLGQYDRAINQFQLSISESSKVKDKHVSRQLSGFALTKLGMVYINLNQYDKALKYLQEAQITDVQWDINTIFFGLGIVYSQQGKHSKALEAYHRALYSVVTGDASARGEILNRIGLLYIQQSDHSNALDSFQKALLISKELKNPVGEAITLSNIASLLKKQGKTEVAITFYKVSVNVTESIRQNLQRLTLEEQKAFAESVAGTYRQLADLLLAKGRLLEAQQVLELLKVQELKDFDRTTRAKIDNGKIELDPTERTIVDKYSGFIAFGQRLRQCQESKPTCAEHDRLLTLRTQAQAEYDRAVKTFETAVRTRKQEDENNFLNPKNRFSGKVQEILETQPNTALIYSLVTDDKLWLVLASKGETLRQFEVKVSQAELNRAVVKFRQLMEQCERRSCSADDTAALNTVGQQLYGWLFPQPLQKELQGKIKHLIFAPDRITRYVPMSALFDGKQYLIENYTVSTIVSAEYTNTDRPNYDPKQATVLAAGLSNAAPPDFQPLTNVPLELAAIVQTATRSGIYPGRELLNQQFDRLSLQKNLSSHTMLHIATHGAFVREQADASYILLGTGQKLPISEIKGLNDLGKIQLVVLSACQTALADRDANGIEIANVSFSFMERGVKAVIASLWQVNDSSTSLLMQQFYKHLATGKLTKAEALQQAQLSLLHRKVTAKDAANRSPSLVPKGSPQTRSNPNADFSHPYYWAPFILIGNSL